MLVSTHYMDEAERCHEIAYIAYGVLLAHGTVEEVIAAAHLATYTVSASNGEGLSKLAEELGGAARRRHGGAVRHQPARVRTRRSGAEAAIAPYRERPGLAWTRSEPSLEDVFIDLMGRAQDNFQ